MKKRIIKNIILVICLSMLTSCGEVGEVNYLIVEEELPIIEEELPIIEEIDVQDDIETIFNTLISSSRTVGTQGEIDARDYLQSQLELIGFDTEIQEFKVYEGSSTNSNDFFDTNPLNSVTYVNGYNVIAQKNFDPSKKTIVFSAHYDTTPNSIGATDNGAGVTALLEASKKIFEFTDILDYNVRIIFFSAEESYIVGSREYLNSLTEDESDNIIANLNVDLTSTNEWRKFLLSGQTSNFSNELLRINEEFELIPQGTSDHISFFKKGIMAISLATLNPLDETFDFETIFNKETENTYVDINLIKEDADIIFEFMKSINIENLEKALTVEEEFPIVEEETPIVEEETPIIEEETPIIEEETPIIEEETPIIEEELPIIEEETPIVEEELPIVEEVIEPTITTNMSLPTGSLTDWNLILLNHGAYNKIDAELDFTKVKFDTQYVDSRAGEYYQKMYDAALKEGITLYLRSGYRSISTQTINYNANVQRIQNQGFSYEEAVQQTNLYYTVPGHSEHHTGLAFDIITPQYHNDVYTLNEKFAETTAYEWLIENCANYGFILRYAQNKTNITEINFEPWHYRYVGIEHAQYIMANNICFEEYIALLKADGR